jgi:hypothetical protein
MMVVLITLMLAAAAADTPPAASSPPVVALVQVRRVHVEKLKGENGEQIRDMIIAALENSKQFQLTEDPERADAVLRGSAEDLVYTDVHQSGESIHAGGAVSAGNGAASMARRSSRYASIGVTESENSRIQERKHEAVAAVRLVSRNGDILWSTTQESEGAKFRSASADVAERVARKLVTDLQAARKPALPKPRE